MKWYQFHLSTFLILTLIAGVLLGLNLTPQPPPQLNSNRDSFYVTGHSYGWPSQWDEARVERRIPPGLTELQRLTLEMG